VGGTTINGNVYSKQWDISVNEAATVNGTVQFLLNNSLTSITDVAGNTLPTGGTGPSMTIQRP
jgi:hypothetical protein